MGKRSREKKTRREGILPGSPSTPRKPGFSVWKKLILAGVILSLFAPLIKSNVFFYPFVSGKFFYLMAVAEAVFFVWLAAAVIHPEYRPKKSAIFFSLAALLVAMAASTVFGADPIHSFWSNYERLTGLAAWIHLFAFFLAVSSSLKKEDWPAVFAVSNLAAAIVSIATLASTGEAALDRGPLGNDSFLGAYLTINVFLSVYLFFHKWEAAVVPAILRKWARVFAAACFSIFIFCLIVEDSDFWNAIIYGQQYQFSFQKLIPDVLTKGARAAKYAVFGGLAMLVPLYFAIAKKGKKRIFGTAVLAAALIAFLAVCVLLFQTGSPVQQKFSELATKGRLSVWQGAWSAFLEKPVFGWGPENFRIVFPSHFDPKLFLEEYGAETRFDRAHNIVVENLVGLGLLGSIAYLAVFGAFFWTLGKLFFTKRIDFGAAAFPAMALAAYFIQNLTVFDTVSSLLMFFLVLGYAASLDAENGKPCPEAEARRPVRPLFPILVSSILFIVSFTVFVAKPAYGNTLVLKSAASVDAEEKISFCEKALSASPVGRYQITSVCGDSFQGLLSNPESKVTMDQFNGGLGFFAGKIKENIERVPNDFYSWSELGQIYSLWSNFDSSKAGESEKALEKALEISSSNQAAYWALARAKISAGKYSEANDLASKAIELEPQFVGSYLAAIEIAEVTGEKTLADRRKEELSAMGFTLQNGK